MRFKIELFIGKLIIWFINRIAPHKGTSFPGKFINRLDEKFLGQFQGMDFDKVVFITGTNGKSTMTNLLYHILKKNNYDVVANLEGANQKCGVATTLMKNSTLAGQVKGEYFLFEIDERSLHQIYRHIPAKHMVITNIQKDQVQRNGDPDFIVRHLESVINNDMILYLNNDEPRSKYFEEKSRWVHYFGVEKNDFSYHKTGQWDISMPCPRCARPIEFAFLNIDNVGQFSCPFCGFASEENPKTHISQIDFGLGRFVVDEQNFDMPYHVPFMLYNYAGAIAVAKNLGLSIESIASAFSTFINIGGRIETLRYGEKDIKYIRIKQENPETLQSALDSVAADKTEKVFVLGLYEIVDFVPHYTNTFYAYDCDISKLIESNVKKYICFSEYVCYDTALRFLHEGVEPEKVMILPTKDAREIFQAALEQECDNIYLITWLKTFQEIKNFVRQDNKQAQEEEQ